ncbi:MAG: secondary thiamine-phosphate synthase enzyme YjbQ [Cocleimonas sp.]
MNTKQLEITINTTGRSTYEITGLVNEKITTSNIDLGVCHVFIQHTSASLIITENADPDVRVDLETIIQRLSPDADPEYLHTLEGPDDMSAHGRNMLTQTEMTIPITNGRLGLGTWQGLYLWEHRYSDFKRNIILTIMG